MPGTTDILEPQISCESCGNRTWVRQRTAILAAAAIPPCRPVLHNGSQMSLRSLILATSIAALSGGYAPGALADPVIDIAERHVRQQSQGLPGKVTIIMGGIAPGPSLPPCTALEAYTPPGARPMGKTQVGVRCLEPKSWNVRIPVHVRVTGSFVSAGRPLTAGKVVQAEDLVVSEGELDALPAGIVIDPGQAVGKTLRNSVAAGQPLRMEQLLAPLVIRQGQTVRVVSRGSGFSVSGDGQALNDAAVGQIARIRMPGGQVIQGLATAEGWAEVNF